MSNLVNLLGRICTDQITGFSGACVGVVHYLTGCNQVLLVPRGSDSTKRPEAEWFDVQRIKVEPNTLLVLDNGDTPGPDAPAPKR